MTVRSDKIMFPGALGEDLAARLDQPSGEPKAYALFAHGVAVLRFDFTGLGASEGEFANTNFSSNVGDLVAAADYMRANLAAPAIVIGHSLGGATVLAAASKIPED